MASKKSEIRKDMADAVASALHAHLASEISDTIRKKAAEVIDRNMKDPELDLTLRHQIILDSRAKRPKVAMRAVLLFSDSEWLGKEIRQLSREKWSGEELALYTTENRPDLMFCVEGFTVDSPRHFQNYRRGYLVFESFDVADVLLVGHYYGDVVEEHTFIERPKRRNIYLDLRVSNVTRQADPTWFSKRVKIGRHEECERLLFPEGRKA